MRRTSRLGFAGFAVGTAASSAAPAGLVTSTAGFGPKPVVESFEKIAAAGNDLALPATYTFPTGSTLHVSHVSGDSFGPFVVAGGFFGLYPADPRIPTGTAYLGQANPGLFDTGLYVTFPADQAMAGAYLATGTYNITYSTLVEAYDASNRLLATATVNGGTVDTWANSFVGFSDVGPIRTLRFDGSHNDTLRIDNLTSVATVPEPAAVAALGLLAVPAVARRRRTDPRTNCRPAAV